MRRRNFIKSASMLLGGSALTPALAQGFNFKTETRLGYSTWSEIRQHFLLSTDYIHMALMLLASHPREVREEIERHRQLFDENPVEHWEKNFLQMELDMQTAAAKYLNAAPEEVVLTDSTSMGLGLLYTGFRLKPGEEILTTTHDHYATEKSLEFAAQKNGASIRRISLYTPGAMVSSDELVSKLTQAIGPKTRLVAVTWVHSCTGVKLPVKRMAEAIKDLNKSRSEKQRIYFCVDGVHGFGIENIDVRDMGCDFLAAGTHKWLFGPRGTGILYGKKDAWPMVIPTIPSFTGRTYFMWMGSIPESPLHFNELCTPGGFHSFEHRWSLNKAFEFHQSIGKDKIESRTHELSSNLKAGLKSMKHIRLITPVSPDLSAGINCFEVEGIKPDDVVARLLKQKIIGSSSPYRVSYVRLTPGILNNEEEVNTCLKALEDMR